MKIVKLIFFAVFAMSILFFAGGIFLPKSYSISRSTLINAPDNLVFKNVAYFNNFIKWNPLTKMEPTAEINISGIPLQAGNLCKWSGRKTGEGQIEITGIKLDCSSIDFALTFIRPYQTVAQSKFTFKRVQGGTKVICNIRGESKSTIEKWMHLNIGNVIDDGLKNLKELSEKN